MILQIGFNKCATTAIFQLLRKSGYGALHSNGKYWRRANHPDLDARFVQQRIADNITSGRPPLQGFEAFDAFLDMELSTADIRIANYKSFAVMADAYPEARFILNTRNKSDWLLSRARHHDGLYLADACIFYDQSPEQVLRLWSAEWDAHIAEVLAFFEASPDRLCHFDTDGDPIAKLAAFVAPVRPVDVRNWSVARVTDVKARGKGWQDKNRDLDIDAILEDENAA